MRWLDGISDSVDMSLNKPPENHEGQGSLMCCSSSSHKESNMTSVQVSSVTQSCLTFCDPMDYSTPGFPVHHQLPELTQTHVHRVMMPSNHHILCCPLLLQPSILPSITIFSNELFFSSGGQTFGVSASASVLPMNIQD